MPRTGRQIDSRNFFGLPEVVEFYRLSGDIDYLMKIRLRDINDYDRVYIALIATAPIADVSSSFTMEELKHTTALPIS